MRHALAFDQVKLSDITLDIENPWNDCRQFPGMLDQNGIFPVDELNLESNQSKDGQADAPTQPVSFLNAQANLGASNAQRETVGRARCYRIRNWG